MAEIVKNQGQTLRLTSLEVVNIVRELAGPLDREMKLQDEEQEIERILAEFPVRRAGAAQILREFNSDT